MKNRLGENIKSELETEFTETEFYSTMKSNKAPGKDGIMSEFYQIYFSFWHFIN